MSPTDATPTDDAFARALALLADDPARGGLVLDFDGTLAPIVDDPTASAMPDSTAQVLADLARHLGALAMVSGRPVSFLAERAAVPGAVLLGLYGMEIWRDGEVAVPDDVAVWEQPVRDAHDRLVAELADAQGVYVEDKGRAVAVHWRNAPDRAAAEERVQALTERLSSESGLHREPGKLVEELRPPVRADKGAALRRVVAGRDLAFAVFAGDDLGDLPAFAAARESGGVALGVAHGEETPAQVREAVDGTVDGVEAFAQWLVTLRDALAARA